jgi:hypothetical protein
MQLEIEQLRTPQGGSSSHDAFPKAAKATAAKSSPKPPPQRVQPDLPETDAAKQARLRRMCERKPSGKIHVPLEVHEKWLHGSRDERDAMVDVLEECGWQKASSIYPLK